MWQNVLYLAGKITLLLKFCHSVPLGSTLEDRATIPFRATSAVMLPIVVVVDVVVVIIIIIIIIINIIVVVVDIIQRFLNLFIKSLPHHPQIISNHVQ